VPKGEGKSKNRRVSARIILNSGRSNHRTESLEKREKRKEKTKMENKGAVPRNYEKKRTVIGIREPCVKSLPQRDWCTHTKGEKRKGGVPEKCGGRSGAHFNKEQRKVAVGRRKGRKVEPKRMLF